MSRQHYEMIAQAIRIARPVSLATEEGGRWLALVSQMAYGLAKLEPEFNRQRFEAACLRHEG